MSTITAAQFATNFRMTPGKVTRLVEDGELNAAPDGTFTEDAVRKFIDTHTYTPSR